MAIADTYGRIPYDLSGSMSKNRFRQELFWGVSRMFDLFDRDDFCVIFDYKCDIEVHFSNAIEFYQIKTHKVQSPYKFSDLKKIPKDAKNSIIGKLFLLTDASSPKLPIKCVIVSNAFLKIGTTPKTDVETFCFSELDDASQEKIMKALQDELSRSTVDITNMHYIYTSMNLLEPQNDLKGKIIGCFEKIKGCEPIKPNALYRLIVETVQQRACYELAAYDYDELVKRKGMTKSDLSDMLDRHKEGSDDSVKKVLDFIDQQKVTSRKKRTLTNALISIVKQEDSAIELKQKEQEVAAYIEKVTEDLTTEEMADFLLKHFTASFTIDYSEEDKFVFILLIVKRWEGGMYEQTYF